MISIRDLLKENKGLVDGFAAEALGDVDLEAFRARYKPESIDAIATELEKIIKSAADNPEADVQGKIKEFFLTNASLLVKVLSVPAE